MVSWENSHQKVLLDCFNNAGTLLHWQTLDGEIMIIELTEINSTKWAHVMMTAVVNILPFDIKRSNCESEFAPFDSINNNFPVYTLLLDDNL